MSNTGSGISDYISRIRQVLTSIDDAGRNVGGLYWQASRICEFEVNGDNGW